MMRMRRMMMSDILMKCGHSANATHDDGQPCCVICAGIHPEAYVIEDIPPDLEGRTAMCSQCGGKRTSSYALPFFSYNYEEGLDGYYCGCKGWS